MARRQKRSGQTGLLGRSAPQPEVSYRPVGKPSKAPKHLLLQIGSSPDSITTIGCEVQDRILLGRADAPTNANPDIDLNPYNAHEKGISRRHLFILRTDDALYVQDPGSRNGTKLNGTPLKKGEPYPLNDGDVLILGALQIVIWYVAVD